jgi:hypothetical protein
MLTSFAMLSQISAIGAGRTGPGTCHALVYSMYAATDSIYMRNSTTRQLQE